MSATPLEVLDLLIKATLDNSAEFGELYAEDAVYELPFAPPGVPARIVGGDRIREFLKASAGASPIRFTGLESSTTHETTDAEVVISEYSLNAEVVGADKRFVLPFVLVLRVRAGRIEHSRSYVNVAVVGEALADLAGA
ncbi:nuclear transport factor 2 family protein [Actinosynnema sp. NPDC020468]|uniref:nuclear transport factor 2 family protein n=1 Tax=Actinosynnema sp. NPDC020468 TaxID=3154488 RepID=UPI0033F7E9AB